MADVNSLNSQLSQLEAQLQTQQAALTATQNEITTIEGQIAQATLANGIEALKNDPEAMTALQSIFAQDGFTISITFS